MASLSSNEMPGREETLMVNDPSLNGGRNERPRVKNRPKNTRNTTTVAANIFRPCPKDQVSRRS